MGAYIKNTYEYDWADVEIQFLGRKIVGARGVKYKTEMEKEEIFGAGREPLAIGRGNKKYSGELTILQSELEVLQKAVGAATILDIPDFDIVVSYAPKDGGPIVTDIIRGAQFTEVEKGMSQGDKQMEVTLPFIALGIDYNV